MYAIKLAEDGRIECATFPKYASKTPWPEPLPGEEVEKEFIPEELIEGYVLVDELPGDDATNYRYVDGEYVYDPLPIAEPVPTQLDAIEAQVTYTAMMTDTLLEV